MKFTFSCLLTCALVFLCLSPLSSAGFDAALSAALDGLVVEEGQTMVVSLGNFTYADKGIAGPFSRFLQEKVGAAVTGHRDFELFSRERLEEIMELQTLSLSGLFDESGTVEIGNLKGIRGLISGRFFDEGESVSVFLELVLVETGTVKGPVEVHIAKTEIPPTVSVLPQNYTDALYVLEELREAQDAGNQGFLIKAWTTRGDGGVYVDGEELVVSFYSNRDCFVKIYHIDVDRKASLIFPNRYFTSNRLEGGKLYSIPDSSYPFRFQLHAPYGVEYIKVIASTVRFDDVEEAFTDLGVVSRETVTRGLSVAATEEQVAETMFSYTIVENVE